MAVEKHPWTSGSLIPGGGERVPTAVHAGLPCRFKARAKVCRWVQGAKHCQTVYPMEADILRNYLGFDLGALLYESPVLLESV